MSADSGPLSFNPTPDEDGILMILVFFVYGLAFFILGLLIFIYPKKGSAFRLADNLWLIAAFGITHGINEWIDMFLLITTPVHSGILNSARLITLPLSFFFLILFGTRTLLAIRRRTLTLTLMPYILPALWGVIVLSSENRFLSGDVMARYLLAAPGVLMTAAGLMNHVREFSEMEPPSTVRCLKTTAYTFLAYGFIAGFIVPEADFFPASVLNYTFFSETFGFPVQVLRALCAVIAAYGLTRVLSVFDWESRDALRKSEEKFRNIYMLSPIGIELYDAQGRLLDANRAALEIFGVSDIVEVRGSQLFGDRELADEIRDALSRVTVLRHEFFIDFDKVKKLKLYDTKKSGGIHIDYIITPLRTTDSGSTYGYMVQIQDITGRKQAKEAIQKAYYDAEKKVEERSSELMKANALLEKKIAEQKMLEKELINAQKFETMSLLAGGIAHGFNNILTGILGNISLAELEQNSKHDMLKRLSEAERLCIRARDLTQQLLTFTRSEALIKKTVNPAEFVKEAADYAVKGSPITCGFTMPDDLWQIDIDEGQMRQVIQNVVLNAVEAMPESGTVHIGCENRTLTSGQSLPLPEGAYLKIIVKDQGAGISQEHIQKIFDPYFTTKKQGSGLGLTVGYSIVKSHGGHIQAESEPGKGAVITIYLPALKGLVPIAEKPVIQTAAWAGRRALIMDDEEMVRSVLSSLLKHMGFDTELAADGEEAIDLYNKAMESGRPFDVVIMDLTVPGGMGGKEAIKKLVEIDPGVKAIVSSGYSDDPIMSKYTEYGFVGMVGKPYKVKELSDQLLSVIRAG